MSSYAALLRLAILNTLASVRTAVSRKDGKVSPAAVVLLGLGILSIVAVAGFLIYGEVMLYSLLARVGQPLLLPAMALLMSMAVTLFMGAFQTLTRLYFSRDSAWMSSLPVTSRTVMAARLTEVYLSETLINLVLLAPLFVMMGLHGYGGGAYILRAAVTLLLSAALPVAVTVVLASVLVRFGALSRHKELVMTCGSVLLLVAVLSLEFAIMPKIPDDAGAMFFVQLFLDQNGLVNTLTSAILPIRWAVEGLAGSWSSFLLFAGVSLLAIGGVVWLMGGRYLEVCTRQSEQATKRKHRKLSSGDWKAASQTMALFRREWSELLRTPAYAINALSSVIVVPLMLAMMAVSIISASEITFADMLATIRGFLVSIPATDLTLILAAVLAFCCWMNPAVATAVTREGRRHDLYRMMPVTPRALLKAKLLTGLSINGLAIIIVAVVAAVLLGSLTWLLIPALALAMLMNYATCALSLALDALHPNYHWTTETQAIKQSMNVLIGMAISIVLLALPIVAWVLLMVNTGLGSLAKAAVATAVLVLECVAAGWLLHGPAEKGYAASEG